MVSIEVLLVITTVRLSADVNMEAVGREFVST
jgi:hypothetical protein